MFPFVYAPSPHQPAAPQHSIIYEELSGAVKVCTFPVYYYAKKLQNEKYKQLMLKNKKRKPRSLRFIIYTTFVLLQLYFTIIIHPFSEVKGKTAFLTENVGTYSKNISNIKFKVVIGM